MWRALGRLSEIELVAPGGAPYAEGDRVVTLAPSAGGMVVTSETGTVVRVDAERRSLLVRMDDGNHTVRLEGDELTASRLAHAYAVTVHRSQGATVQRAHALEDGGGRELAYVKMSRARERSSVYVVADSLEQAKEDLRRDWGTDRRLGWVIDTGAPVTEPLEAEVSRAVHQPMRDALRHGRLVAERKAILAVAPADPTAQIRAAELQRRRLEAERKDLAEGTGRYRDHPIAEALGRLSHAESNVARLERTMSGSDRSRKERRAWRTELEEWQPKLAAARRDVADVTGPVLTRLDKEEQALQKRLDGLWRQRETHQSWVASHPEAERRLDHLSAGIALLDEALDTRAPARDLPPSLRPERWAQVARSQDRSRGLDLGR